MLKKPMPVTNEVVMEKEAGFTLIEMIAVLLLCGVVGTVAVFGLVQGMKGYVFARENVA